MLMTDKVRCKRSEFCAVVKLSLLSSETCNMQCMTLQKHQVIWYNLRLSRFHVRLAAAPIKQQQALH